MIAFRTPSPGAWLHLWAPRRLAWWIAVGFAVGSACFAVGGFSTGDALIAGFGAKEEDLLVWRPNIIGCVCFLISSVLAWVELSHGAWSFAPRSVSWWIVVVNLAGSVAFQLSAVDSFVRPGASDPHALWLAGFYTFVGALCFLLGSYLLIPELFEGNPTAQGQ